MDDILKTEKQQFDEEKSAVCNIIERTERPILELEGWTLQMATRQSLI